MIHKRVKIVFCGPIALGVGCMLLCGCGDHRPPGVDLQGSVTWQGKPVPTGFVVFSPDPAKGSGHQGIAPIQDGRYDTRKEGGRCVAVGPQVAMVAGFDQPDPTKSQTRGARLFLPHEQPVEIKADSSELNLVVPDSVSRLAPNRIEE
jgi:hypothetical protein